MSARVDRADMLPGEWYLIRFNTSSVVGKFEAKFVRFTRAGAALFDGARIAGVWDAYTTHPANNKEQQCP